MTGIPKSPKSMIKVLLFISAAVVAGNIAYAQGAARGYF
jgi:hypothetical protein